MALVLTEKFLSSVNLMSKLAHLFEIFDHLFVFGDQEFVGMVAYKMLIKYFDIKNSMRAKELH